MNKGRCQTNGICLLLYVFPHPPRFASSSIAREKISHGANVVNMGVKNPDGSVCYITGVLKTIRSKLNKHDGDTIHVVIEEKETQDVET